MCDSDACVLATGIPLIAIVIVCSLAFPIVLIMICSCLLNSAESAYLRLKGPTDDTNT